MWSFEMNRCIHCPKIDTCPDAKLIQRTLRKLLDDVDTNEGGSKAGTIVVVCRDTEVTNKI